MLTLSLSLHLFPQERDEQIRELNAALEKRSSRSDSIAAAPASIFPPLVVEAAEEGAVRRSQRLAAHRDTQQTQAHVELQQCRLELEQCRAELDLCRTELRLKTLGKRTGRGDLLSSLSFHRSDSLKGELGRLSVWRFCRHYVALELPNHAGYHTRSVSVFPPTNTKDLSQETNGDRAPPKISDLPFSP